MYVIGITCFNECFLLYVITGRHCFLKSLLLPLSSFLLFLPFYEASDLKEVCILFFIATKQYNINTKFPKSNFCFLNYYYFLMLHVFLYKLNFLTLSHPEAVLSHELNRA